MFTLYSPTTREVHETVVALTEDLAYRRAERIAERKGLVFDDTCDHGTAYDLCGECAAVTA